MPYLRLAGLLLREGRKDEADAVVQQLRSKQPSSAEVASSIGDFYLAGRNIDGALKEYQRGLSYDPKNQMLQVRVLETYINSGRIDEAQKMVDQPAEGRSGRHHRAHDQRPPDGDQGQSA